MTLLKKQKGVRYNMKNETWKPVVGYEGLYEVSDTGLVRSLNWERTKQVRVLRPGNVGRGYLFVQLSKDGHVKNFLVHRLVAQAFIPNPQCLPQVNHKDEDKENNSVANLEWCTARYNINYGTCSKRMAEKLRGRNLSEETRKKMSKTHRGKHWFNNGEKELYAFECPEGFVPGRMKK